MSPNKKYFNPTRYSAVVILLLLLHVSLFTSSFSTEALQYTSPEYLTVLQDNLIISDITGKRLIFLDRESQAIHKIFQLEGEPGKVSASDDGKRLFVPIAESKGKLAVLNFRKGTLISEIEVGHTPVEAIVSGNIAYVINKFSSTVSVADLKKGEVNSTIPVIREPIGAVLSNDGKYLFVANSLPDMPGDASLITAAISIINTGTLKKERDILLPNGSNGLKDICLSHDGRFAYVTHVLGRYQLIPTQIERGWINTNALSIIDIEKREYYNTVLLDDVDHGAANPWGVTCSANGETIYIALAGTHELCLIDRIGLHKKLEAIDRGDLRSSIIKKPEDVKYDFSFLYGLKRRIQTESLGPRRVAETDGVVYISDYFSGTITTCNSELKLNSISLGDQPPPGIEREGELLFHDASICYQQWQSCSSCHPDARTDGLNWDLLNDGIGNPKNTKSLVLSHFTPPAMVTGIRADAETAVRAGMKYILFAQRPEREAEAIDAYLSSLHPLSSPMLINGELSDAAIRGETVFRESGCADCHNGTHFTNMKKYNVGTGDGRENGRLFDTPALNEAWRNSPYLYDGRALTLKEVITIFNKSDQHGRTSNLSDQEVKDLEEYLESL
ncbi:MAG: c-type cytochrome [Bacteroidetes bacterium]|nr:c-type cytochrome [Bacteroidota bacterium]